MENAKSDHYSIVFDLILGIIAIILVAISGWSVTSTWSESSRLSELKTTSKFVGVRTSPRVTETPGINSWVTLLLENLDVDTSEITEYLRIVNPGQGNQIPEFLKPYSQALRSAQMEPAEQIKKQYKTEPVDQSLQNRSISAFRDIGLFAKPGFFLVATLQRNERTRPKDPEYFCELVYSCREQLAQKLDIDSSITALGKPRLSRVYLLDEFGNFFSHPFLHHSPRNRDEILNSEFQELQKNQLSPTFANNDFFFRFDFDKPLDRQQSYSGIYLDQGGLGLVCTIAIPTHVLEAKCVLAVDIEFDFDWSKQIQHVKSLAVSEMVELPNMVDDEIWHPWNQFLNALKSEETVLHKAVTNLAKNEFQNQASVERKSVYHETSNNGMDVVAIQVNRNRWLLFTFNEARAVWPWLTIVLSAITISFLFFRIESGRRTAIRSRMQAATQLREKQNLLNTMQVPLMVSDPNTDEIVFCNEAASEIGMKVGSVFGRDVVMDTEFAQNQYLRMQSSSEESRRAYGVPIQVRKNDHQIEERLAIVRSVAVSAPIQTIKADQRHRLGILFLINQEYDLGYLLEEKVNDTKNQERRLLSGLLNHGLESLSIMLSDLIQRDSAQGRSQENQEMIQWLAEYISQRINVLGWALENWAEQPKLLDQRVLDRSTVQQTVNRYLAIFELAQQDRQLRQQLHWNNGTLSQNISGPVIEMHLDWPDDIVFQIPKDGLFGFFVGEVLVNAIKHGEPGSHVVFKVTHDPVRAELKFEVANECRQTRLSHNFQQSPFQQSPYGGQTILNQVSKLCQWTYSTKVDNEGRFLALWKINSIRSSVGQGD